MELYAQVRRAVYVEGLSRREAARRFGIDPRTVAKMLAFSVPPGSGAQPVASSAAPILENRHQSVHSPSSRARNNSGHSKSHPDTLQS